MKRTQIAAAGFALFAASGLAAAASWSVIVQPGVYGRVAIGGYAEMPQVYAPQPVVVVDDGYGQVVEEYVDPAYATDQAPVYLWVPEYQRLHWAQYCREYGAYGVPVYFVDDGWYRANVMRRNWTPEQRSWSQQQWQEQDRLARDHFERQRFEQQRYEEQQRWNQQRAWRGQQQEQHPYEAQNRMRPGSAHAYVPLPQHNDLAPRPPSQVGGQWQQPVNAGQRPPVASQPGGAGRGAPTQNAGDRQGDERGQDRSERHGQGEGRATFEHGRDGKRDR
jgi:hypothetical protein